MPGGEDPCDGNEPGIIIGGCSENTRLLPAPRGVMLWSCPNGADFFSGTTLPITSITRLTLV